MDEQFFHEAMKATGLNVVYIDENTQFPQRSEQQGWTVDYLIELTELRVLQGSSLDLALQKVSNAHSAALTVERERREQAEENHRDLQKVCEVQLKLGEKLRLQVVSALAAIEKVLDYVETCRNNSCPVAGNVIYGELCRVNLSLLHKHDTEVRKPLVDLILELRDDLAAPKSPLWGKFNDLLAKVKESK